MRDLECIFKGLFRSKDNVFICCPISIWSMGVESGGTRPPPSKNQRGTSPQKWWYIFTTFFSSHRWKFCIFNHFQNKVAEIRRETKFWGRWVRVPINPSPQTKLRGDLIWYDKLDMKLSFCQEYRETLTYLLIFDMQACWCFMAWCWAISLKTRTGATNQ